MSHAIPDERSLFTVTNESDFFVELQRNSKFAVPFVGAGLGGPAGEPSFPELNRGMAELAGTGWLTAGPELDLNGFDVAAALEAEFSPEQVREFACQVVKGYTNLVATPQLQALVRVRSKLIITTNYGMAIENAAKVTGVPYRSISAREFPIATTDRDELVVMHLHGRQDDPDGIVLTPKSYDRVFDDESVRQFLRDTALRERLIFLGHRLAPDEKHILAHVRWAVEAGRARTARTC